MIIFYLYEISVNSYANFLRSFDKIKLVRLDLEFILLMMIHYSIIDKNTNFLKVSSFIMFIKIIYAFLLKLFFVKYLRGQGIIKQ